MTDLFSQLACPSPHRPLADRLRPKSFDEFIGQAHLTGPAGKLKKLLARDHIPSLIFWGPPGTGKTTLASLIAQHTQRAFITLSAVTANIKEAREVIEAAKERQRLSGKGTILFIDEIHRFNRAQQDAFLPHVETGTITLIGATTQNPSFEINSALLSRLQVLHLEMLGPHDLKAILQRALRETKNHPCDMAESVQEILCDTAMGDARRLLNTLETAHQLASEQGRPDITQETLAQALDTNALPYDRDREEHYNIISAFIKSMRGSDPDAALYWLARMLEAGEDPLFIARRMVIFASEDIGNADPQAITIVHAVRQSFEFIGLPEGWIPLAQGVTYLACAPKSNASYLAYLRARDHVQKTGNLSVPMHLRNAPTDLMKKMGYGKDYRYPHDHPQGYVKATYLPEKLAGTIFYEPTDRGYDAIIRQRLEEIRKK